MGKLLIAAILMLVAGDNAIADDQGSASTPPSQSLMLACSGLLTITGGPKSGQSAVSHVSAILYSNSDNVFSSLFDVALPVTGLEGDDLLFARTWENDGIKYRADGAIGIDGSGAVFNEIFVLNGVVTISFWYLHCKEGTVPPPVDLTPASPPLIVPKTPPSYRQSTKETAPPQKIEAPPPPKTERRNLCRVPCPEYAPVIKIIFDGTTTPTNPVIICCK